MKTTRTTLLALAIAGLVGAAGQEDARVKPHCGATAGLAGA
jgi:hypothetical protein